MKKVIKVINAEIDRLFTLVNGVRQAIPSIHRDIGVNTDKIENLYGYLTDVQTKVAMLLTEDNTMNLELGIDQRMDKVEIVLNEVCAGLADFEMEYYQIKDHVDSRLDKHAVDIGDLQKMIGDLNHFSNAKSKKIDELCNNVGKFGWDYKTVMQEVDRRFQSIEDRLCGQREDLSDTETRLASGTRYIAAHGIAIEDLQNHLEHVEDHIMNHVDPRLLGNDTNTLMTTLVKKDENGDPQIIRHHVHDDVAYDNKTRELITDIQGHLDYLEKRFQHMEAYLSDPSGTVADVLADEIADIIADPNMEGAPEVYPKVRIGNVEGMVETEFDEEDTDDLLEVTRDVVEENDNVWLRLNPMPNTPEPHVNQFYTGPANPSELPTQIASGYRYRVAESLSGGDPIIRNDIHGILVKLSEHDIKALMMQCEDRATRCANTFTLNQAFITE